MKKTYIAPSMDVVKVAAVQPLLNYSGVFGARPAGSDDDEDYEW